MAWRRLLLLSVSAGVSLTILELVLLGHTWGISTAFAGTICRVLSFTILATSLLAFAVGIVGAMLAPRIGLHRESGAAAGVLAASLPTALYLSDASFPWDHDLYAVWFAVGIPVGLVAGLLMAKGLPSRGATFVARLWPAVGPLLACILIYQASGQGAIPLAVPSTVRLLALGLAGMVALLAVARFPAVGYAFAIGVLAVSLAGSAVTPNEPQLDRPSQIVSGAPADAHPVILLTVDTLRWDAISLYGAETPTPAIDALAADSVVFDKAYSTAPWTYVAFTSIHTGLTPWGHGVTFAEHPIPQNGLALAPMMRDFGYNTGVVGYNALLTNSAIGGSIPASFGDSNFFPRYLRPETKAHGYLDKAYPDFLGMEATTEQLGEYGSAWVRNHQDSPFFFWLHFFDPHYPYEIQEDFPPGFEPSDRVRQYTGDLLDRELRRGRRWPGIREWARALYQGEVQAVDRAIGRFIETLKQEGLYDRAIIIFTSDHGEEFAEHNAYGHLRTLYNDTVRVPLFVKLPSSSVTSRHSVPVSTVAVAPTIFDLAKVPYDPAGFSGNPLRMIWEGEDSRPAQPAFMTGTVNAEPARAVVWDNYKLIRWINFDHWELYDQDADPYEQYNLANRLPEQVAIGRALLADHAVKAAERALARGLTMPEQKPLTEDERNILRGLGYLQ